MSANMWDMTGWRKVECGTSDAILIAHPDRRVGSSLTDLDGEFGEPVVFTEWDSNDSPILRNYRWPRGGRACEHWVREEGPTVAEPTVTVPVALIERAALFIARSDWPDDELIEALALLSQPTGGTSD